MKPLKLLTLLWLVIAYLFSLKTYAQGPAVASGHTHRGGPLHFVENKKQWPEEVLFKTTFEGAHTLFIGEQGFTYLLTSPEDLNEMHLRHQAPISEREKITIRQHAYRTRFVGSSPAKGIGIAKRALYHNYFLGNDPANWSNRVGLFGKVVQENLYPGIHLETYSQAGHLKYDLIVTPGADPTRIKIRYEGTDSVGLFGGNLHIYTSVGLIQEMAPIAWQEIEGERKPVPVYFAFENNTLSYTFPDGYDKTHELVIDPVIIASTLTGTGLGADILGNFGHSATFDNGGNIYAAGISFVTTFPATLGAFQTSWAGGTNDIAVIKYNPDGSSMIYATYIGGMGGDFPHSLITDYNQQLYIYGSTNSSNYPVTANAFQPIFGGANDIVVTVLNQDGTALVGSTFVGGSGNDGYNQNTNLPTHSFGDEYRGEIVLDGQNNIYVVSNSQSVNFPVTAGAFDNSLTLGTGVNQDVVVFKANSDLSVLYWSTFLGGNGIDSGNGIRVDKNQNVYVTGTARGDNFPTTPGSFQAIWPGGQECAFISKLSANGSTLLASTFFGTNGRDNGYFLDIDEDEQVHIFGKTTGVVPITPPGTYSGVPGSKQFLAAFSSDLTERIFSTVIGKGPTTTNYDFVPVAFMVDKCNGIYFSGYHAYPGLPVTPGSFPDLITNNNDFYIGVLTPLAAGLHYATYYGEADHVDGGTSRFDKGGVVYQGVCSCNWSGNLTTLPNAWATGQQNGCDIGVFKIDLEIEAINANGIALPGTSGCAPFQVDFVFTGTNAITYQWAIDGTVVSNQPNMSHTFLEPGSYEVGLFVANPAACNPTDTFFLQIEVLDGESTLTDTTLCSGQTLYLDAATLNGTYAWQNGSTASTFVVQEPGIYWVDVSIVGCSRRDSFLVNNFSKVPLDLGQDTFFCDVPHFVIDVSDPGLVSYLWQDGTTNPQFTASVSGLYSVVATDTSGCLNRDSIHLLFSQTPVTDLGPDVVLCAGETITLTQDLQNSLALWQNGSTGNTFLVEAAGTYWVLLNKDSCTAADTVVVEYLPEIFPNATATSILCASDCNGTAAAIPSGGAGTGFALLWSTGATSNVLENLCPGSYSVTVTDANECTAQQSVTVNAPPPLAVAIAVKDVKCAGDMNGQFSLDVTGGYPPYTYSLIGGNFGNTNGVGNLPGGDYPYTVKDSVGCNLSGIVNIYEPEAFFVNAGEDIHIQLGEATQLNGWIFPFSNQVISWFPNTFLDCTDCPNPNLCPTVTTLYVLTVTDPITGCLLMDSVSVTVDKERLIFIPNAFSPNNDGINDAFTVYAGAGVTRILELKVFDRWGELVFENYNFQPNDPLRGWDGTLKDTYLNPAVFVYYARVLFKDEVVILYEGGVHLVR